MAPSSYKNFIVNVDKTQSLAVKSKMHVPIVFDHPERYQREGFYVQKNVLNTLVNSNNDNDINSSRAFLNEIANSANQSSNLISEAWAKYTRKVDYGIDAVDLDKIAALIEADLPTRLYYCFQR